RGLELSQGLRERHYDTARQLLGPARYERFHSALEQEFDSLDELLRGIAAVGELSPRTSDYVVSYGERLSSKIVTAAFGAMGLNSALVDAREVMITDGQHTKAVPLVEEVDCRSQKIIAPLLAAGRVPVVGGFIGSTKEKVQTTIGRGGSDYSAALFGAALNAEVIEIWTDVDGMMTTDPHICPDAHRIKVISFEEAAELAYFGAKVLHPATVMPAVRKNIPVRVLNSRNPRNEGTLIVSQAPHSKSIFKAIAAKKGITIIDVCATRMLMAHGFLRQIFEVFDRHRCSVDVVATSEVSVSVTVDSTQSIPQIMADLKSMADVHFKERNAIVCLVGENIREKAGIAAQIFTALGNINVRMVSQGASEINITFVIDEEQVPEAIRRLHKHFFSAPDPNIFD
ncbi:MAG: lysine-sensitive aspartokinase 3, partial [Candidatus Korobacteraceae bacterium]